MFELELKNLSDSGLKKTTMLENQPGGYFLLSMLAGVYVGFGIVLIFSIGGPIQALAGGALLKLVMGISFGIALSLVVFAGSELFTGNNMVGVVGWLAGAVSPRQLLALLAICFLGNMLGSLLLAGLVIGSGSLGPDSHRLILKVVELKMNLPAGELFLRGILCNWLVCLALWMCGRTQSDVAKLVLIFWCLFGFIASGFEHCVANMTLLTLGFLIPHGTEISMAGMLHNLFWVTLGNFVGGAGMVTLPYWWASRAGRSKGREKVLEIKALGADRVEAG